VVQRDAIADQPDNNRAVLRDFDRPRGEVVTADGVVVARSVPSVGTQFEFQREYPTTDLFANVVGYYTYAFNATKIEKKYTEVLAGRTSEQQVRSLTNIFSGEDNTGSVQLTMRADLQQVAKEALGEREGSVVLMDPRTGAVLAMYSYPSYDPNFVVVHDYNQAKETLEFLDTVPGKPTLANAFQERYMPGSTFKVVTTGIALENGVIGLDSVWERIVEWVPPQTDNPIQNYEGSNCGGDLAEVFRRSCNIPFAQISAIDLGAAAMVAGTQAWGFGEPIPFDIPGAVASNFGTVEELQDNIPRLAIRGFGQDDDLMVPLHMAMVASTVANGGEMMQPFAVAATLDHDGGVLDRTEPTVWKTPISPGTASTLRDLMVGVVQSGTASCCLQLANGVQAAAKTGTAQLNNSGEPERSHAWITAFAPAEAPRFAIAVVLKGTTAEISAGTGGRLAGPIAQSVLDYALTLPAG
jgi:peptidoglycan glycosyltransferase